MNSSEGDSGMDAKVLEATKRGQALMLEIAQHAAKRLNEVEQRYFRSHELKAICATVFFATMHSAAKASFEQLVKDQSSEWPEAAIAEIRKLFVRMSDNRIADVVRVAPDGSIRDPSHADGPESN